MNDKAIDIEIEKSKLNREKAITILNKGIIFYFFFLILGIIGLVNEYISMRWFNITIVMGLLALIVGILPYIRTINREERKLDDLLRSITDKED